MRNIYLYGKLAKKYGKHHKLAVDTAGEAIRAINCGYPEFIKDLRDGEWHVVRGKTVDAGFDLGPGEIVDFKLGNGDLHIMPVVKGSKRQGLLKIILGVVLVGAAFFLSGGALGTTLASSGMLSGVTYGNIAMLGVALALAGVSQMLSPEDNKETKDQSYTFSGPGNGYGQGSPVPLVYGEVICGSAMISGGVDIDRLAPGSAGGGSFGGGGKK